MDVNKLKSLKLFMEESYVEKFTSLIYRENVFKFCNPRNGVIPEEMNRQLKWTNCVIPKLFNVCGHIFYFIFMLVTYLLTVNMLRCFLKYKY